MERASGYFRAPLVIFQIEVPETSLNLLDCHPQSVPSLFMQRWGFPIENHFPDGSWRDNLRPQPMIPDNIFQFPLNV